MSEENPGVDLYRDALYIIDSGTNVTKLRDVVAKLAALGKKLAANDPVGSPTEEGYLRRGWLRDQLVEKKAATRLVDMLLTKMNGEAFESEMPATSFAPVPMPAAVSNLSKAKVMLITDGGLVPKGNPDRIEGTAATRWGSYNVEGRDDLRAEDYEVSHGGYDTPFGQEEPHPPGPPDPPRQNEKKRGLRKLPDEFISTFRPPHPPVDPPPPGRGI